MMRRMKLNSLRSKMILLCAVSLMLAMAAQSYGSSVIYQSRFLEQYSQAVHESLAYGAGAVASYAEDVVHYTGTLNRNQSYVNLLQGRASQEGSVRKSLDSAVQGIFMAHDEILRLTFWTAYDQSRTRISRERSIYAYNWSTVEALADRYDFSYEELCASGFLLGSNHTFELRGVQRSCFSAVWSIPGEDGLPMAIMIAEIDFSAIDRFFSEIKPDAGEKLLWLDSRDRPIYFYGLGGGEASLWAERTAGCTDAEIYETVKVDDVGYLLFASDALPDGSRLVRAVPQSVFSGAVRDANLASVAICVLAMLVAVLAVSWGIQRLTKPIQRLGSAMLELGRGNFGAKLSTEDVDAEVKPLLERFNEMSGLIGRLITEKYALVIEQQKAELRALQAQINPHFLYNTLQMVSGFALKRNAYEISAIVNALGSMLRYCLQSADTAVPLREEVENVQRYLTIQQVRFLSRLTAEIDIDPQVEGLLLPRMTLQPLVENCIVHGMGDQVAQCVVRITARERNGRAEIEVRNIGSEPMEDAEIRRLEAYIYDGNPPKHEHIGLKNCYLRLKYFFGDLERFCLSSSKAEGTCVHISIRMPKEQCDEVSDR